MLSLGHGMICVDTKCTGVNGWLEPSPEWANSIEGFHGVPTMRECIEFTVSPDGGLRFRCACCLICNRFAEGLLKPVDMAGSDRCSSCSLMATVGDQQVWVGVR